MKWTENRDIKCQSGKSINSFIFEFVESQMEDQKLILRVLFFFSSNEEGLSEDGRTLMFPPKTHGIANDK